MSVSASLSRSLLLSLWATGPRRIVLVLAVGAGMALTEGAAVLLLVPLLWARSGPCGDDPSGLVKFAQGLPDRIGLGGTLTIWVGIVIAYGVLAAWRERESVAIQHGFAHRCRIRLFGAIAGMEWQAFVQYRSAHIFHMLTELQGRVMLGTARMLQAATQVLVVLTYLGMALLVDPWGGLLVVFGGAILAALQMPWFRNASVTAGPR